MQITKNLNKDYPYFSSLSTVERSILCVIGLLAIAGCIPNFAVILLRYSPEYTMDFGAYYLAAYVLNSGGELYQPSAIMAASEAAGNVPFAAGYLYPPFFAAILRPLANVSFFYAAMIWLILNIILVIMSVIILVKTFDLPRITFIPLLICTFLMPSVYDTILIGQVSILLTFLLVVALHFTFNNSSYRYGDIYAGIFLGTAIIIKIYPIVMLLFYLLYRRTKTIASTGITLCVAFMIGIIYGGGWANTKQWFVNVFPYLSVATPIPTDQSLRPVIQRFVIPSTYDVPSDFFAELWTNESFISGHIYPVISSPLLGTVITYVLTIIIICFTIKHILAHQMTFHHHSVIAIDFALVVTTMLLASPLIRDIYFVHLLIPIVIIVMYGHTLSLQRWLLLLACSMILLHRYWRLILLFNQSPFVMMFGFLGVLCIWIALLLMPMTPGPMDRQSYVMEKR